VSPLKAAEDALVLDTSAMTIDAAVAAAVAEVRRRLAKE
jgi:cytidylate kinase